jgi:hypothetical protein
MRQGRQLGKAFLTRTHSAALAKAHTRPLKEKEHEGLRAKSGKEKTAQLAYGKRTCSRPAICDAQDFAAGA